MILSVFAVDVIVERDALSVVHRCHDWTMIAFVCVVKVPKN